MILNFRKVRLKLMNEEQQKESKSEHSLSENRWERCKHGNNETEDLLPQLQYQYKLVQRVRKL